MNVSAPVIPVIDLREAGPPQHARQRATEARALRDACLAFFPRPALAALPALDWTARRWLERARSPYLAEIAAIAEALNFSGVWMLNASYQWGCTSLVREQNGVPWLVRTLDWPFHGLGLHAEVMHMRGRSGDFYNVGWPGYVGVLTAMAPMRFAACLNQAPMRRRTAHRWLRPYDFVLNWLAGWNCTGRMPPDQLLRQVFEICDDYRDARRMLETVPIARPAIFTLGGSAAGECCVIERTETEFVTREAETSAANDWLPERPRWEGRIGTRRFLSSSFADAASYSRARREALAHWLGSPAEASFDWVCAPVLNPYTRLAIALCPASGILRVVGYELTGGALPEPVTQPCELPLSPSLQPA
jgi:hypothetical protein